MTVESALISFGSPLLLMMEDNTVVSKYYKVLSFCQIISAPINDTLYFGMPTIVHLPQ